MERRLNLRVELGSDLATTYERLAAEIARSAKAAVKERGEFRLVLAGGSTPRALYLILVDRYRDSLPWERVVLCWGDERCVPPGHPDSNFGSARKALLEGLLIPGSNVHRMEGEVTPPETAASRYGSELSALARPGEPLFDLVLLGLGKDGHTASLFPRSPALEERVRKVVAVRDPGQPPLVPRITLTLPALASSRALAFLATGVHKAGAVKEVFGSFPSGSADLPASLVRSAGTQTWYLDPEAASRATELLSAWKGA